MEDSESDLQSQLVFFDNCVSRVAKKPVHYLDLVGALSSEADAKPVSPLVSAIVEQWPFVVKAGDDSTEKAVATWISKLLGHLRLAGEDKKALKTARDALIEATEAKKTKSIFKKCFKDVEDGDAEDKMDIDSELQPGKNANKLPPVDLDEIFGFLPTEGTSHNALHRWEREEIEVSIEQGRISELILCLSSEHEEVRRQAFASIVRFMAKLKVSKSPRSCNLSNTNRNQESSYSDWRSVYILAGELLETVNSIGLEQPVPWLISECASNCLSVLINPLHKVYGKVNKFLQKAPSWELEKIPSYWIDKIFLQEPEFDDGYFDEIDWLLNLFVRSLRSKADMEVFRRSNVFERILSLYQSPSLNDSARRKILHVIYRAAQVGGSTTLVTRAAIISWIQIQAAEAEGRNVAILYSLARKLYDTSDQERVNAWSGGTVERILDELAEA